MHCHGRYEETSSSRPNERTYERRNSNLCEADDGASRLVRYFEMHHTALPNLSYPLKVRRWSADVASPFSTGYVTLRVYRARFLLSSLLPQEEADRVVSLAVSSLAESQADLFQFVFQRYASITCSFADWTKGKSEPLLREKISSLIQISEISPFLSRARSACFSSTESEHSRSDCPYEIHGGAELILALRRRVVIHSRLARYVPL